MPGVTLSRGEKPPLPVKVSDTKMRRNATNDMPGVCARLRLSYAIVFGSDTERRSPDIC